MEDLSCPVCREQFSTKTPNRNFLAEKVIHALNILRTDKNSSIRVFPPKMTRQIPDENVNKEADRFSGKEDFPEDRLARQSDKNDELANNNNDISESDPIPPDDSKDFSENPVESNENNSNELAISEIVLENPIESDEMEANELEIPEENTFETEVEVYQENQDEILEIQTYDINAPEDVLPEKFEGEQTLDLPPINLKSELQPEPEPESELFL